MRILAACALLMCLLLTGATPLGAGGFDHRFSRAALSTTPAGCTTGYVCDCLAEEAWPEFDDELEFDLSTLDMALVLECVDPF